MLSTWWFVRLGWEGGVGCGESRDWMRGSQRREGTVEDRDQRDGCMQEDGSRR